MNYLNLADIMARFENTNPLYNNPGGLTYTDFSKQYGAIAKTNSGLAIFPDYETGRMAQSALIEHYANKGSTIQDMINAWSPSNAKGNSATKTNNYINYVAKEMGVDKTTPVSSTSDSGGFWDSVKKQASVAAGIATGGIVGDVTGQSDQFFGLSVGRTVSIILGLICIGGGLMMFKPVRDVVINTSEKAAMAAAVA